MILKSRMFKRITIVGVGLMGGSLGLAIKKHKLAKEVVGLSYKQSSIVSAIKYKAIDIGFTDVQKAVKNSDLVVLATPVDSIMRLIQAINPYIRRGCIVTDLGSTKAEIVEIAEKTLSNPGFFVGGHPLTGSEKKGVDNAYADLYYGSKCIITPTEITNQIAKEKIKHLWTKIGAQVDFLSPERHDEILAHTSHLPHLLAYSLTEALPEEFFNYVSKGFKDTTRIASSSPRMWSDICLSNSKNIVNSIDDVVRFLAGYRKAIVMKDEKTLTSFFSKAKEKRDKID